MRTSWREFSRGRATSVVRGLEQITSKREAEGDGLVWPGEGSGTGGDNFSLP